MSADIIVEKLRTTDEVAKLLKPKSEQPLLKGIQVLLRIGIAEDLRTLYTLPENGSKDVSPASVVEKVMVR